MIMLGNIECRSHNFVPHFVQRELCAMARCLEVTGHLFVPFVFSSLDAPPSSNESVYVVLSIDRFTILEVFNHNFSLEIPKDRCHHVAAPSGNLLTSVEAGIFFSIPYYVF